MCVDDKHARNMIKTNYFAAPHCDVHGLHQLARSFSLLGLNISEQQD